MEPYETPPKIVPGPKKPPPTVVDLTLPPVPNAAQPFAENKTCLECGEDVCDVYTYYGFGDNDELLLELRGDTSINNKQRRFRMYQSFIQRKYGNNLGYQNRKKPPQCVIQVIHYLFPSFDGKYVGFQEAMCSDAEDEMEEINNDAILDQHYMDNHEDHGGETDNSNKKSVANAKKRKAELKDKQERRKIVRKAKEDAKEKVRKSSGPSNVLPPEKWKYVTHMHRTLYAPELDDEQKRKKRCLERELDTRMSDATFLEHEIKEKEKLERKVKLEKKT